MRTGCGTGLRWAAFADDNEDRNLIAVAAAAKGGEYLGRKLAGPEIVVIGDTPKDVACGKHIGAAHAGCGHGRGDAGGASGL